MITKIVSNLNGSEFKPVDGSTLRQQIRSFYASIGGVAKSKFGEVLLDDKSVKSDLGHPNYQNKTCSFAAVKDVLENGIITKPMAHYGVHGKRQKTGVISANIMIKETPFKMDVVVIKNEDEVLRVRCHDVYQTTLVENHQKGLITKRIRRTLIESPSCCPNGDSSAKVQQNPETTKDNNIKTKNYTNMDKKQIRLTESDLRNIIKESVSKILNEISFKKLADAASAASDRESIFKDTPSYPDTPMRRHYTDDGKLDVAQYEKDSKRGIRMSKQPQKFKNAAFTQLSREICGEDDFFAFLTNYIQTNGMDGTIQKMIQDYKDGEDYILNNKTKWSGRN